ncbi:MAG: hypothetical protein ACLR8N_13850 [Lachnospiraceae bacterium]
MSERIDVFSALKNPPVKRKQWESFGSYCDFITNRVRKTVWLCEIGGGVKCNGNWIGKNMENWITVRVKD